jgi:hypothetical protein
MGSLQQRCVFTSRATAPSIPCAASQGPIDSHASRLCDVRGPAGFGVRPAPPCRLDTERHLAQQPSDEQCAITRMLDASTVPLLIEQLCRNGHPCS